MIREELERRLNMALFAMGSSRDNMVFRDEGRSMIIRVSLNKASRCVKAEERFVNYLCWHGCFVPKVLGSLKVQNRPCLFFQYVEHVEPVIDAWSARQASNELFKIHEVAKEFLKTNDFNVRRTVDSDLRAFLDLARAGAYRNARNVGAVVSDMEWAKDFMDEYDMGLLDTVLHGDFKPK
jgi:hypothetical protein